MYSLRLLKSLPISKLSKRCVSLSSVFNSQIGFIGLGNMGNHMARNLIAKGNDLCVFDISETTIRSFTELGAKSAKSPAEIAEKCEIIITMLPSNAQVLEVYNSKVNGIASSIKKSSLLLDCSTIDPAVSREVGNELEKIGAIYMDCPVSGGVNAARDGTLTFMVGGGDLKSFENAKNILEKMGKNIVHCGVLGNGQAAKICNNMLLAISMIGTSEAMNLGVNLGLKPELLAKILNMSSGRCWSSELYNPYPGVLPNVPSSNDYKGGFGSALMNKDLGLAEDAALATKSEIPLGKLSHEIYQDMIENGYEMKDFSSALEYLQKTYKK